MITLLKRGRSNDWHQQWDRAERSFVQQSAQIDTEYFWRVDWWAGDKRPALLFYELRRDASRGSAERDESGSVGNDEGTVNYRISFATIPVRARVGR